MPTIEFVRNSLAPTALIIAERDAIVPARRSAPLRAAITNLVFERTIREPTPFYRAAWSTPELFTRSRLDPCGRLSRRRRKLGMVVKIVVPRVVQPFCC
jgi:hypothetical protein